MRRAGLVAVALLAAAACAVNPVTGRRELMLLSQDQEIQLGRDNDELVVAEYGLYDDPELGEWIAQVGQTMAAASERPELPWTFRVVDDTIVNAFALPGGYIYMTRGILAYMNSEAEAVGVLGHEIGHVTARHGAQRHTSASLAQIGLGAGSVLSSEVRALGGILQTGVGLLFLKFGRDDELQSDQLGVRDAVGAGYDPRRLAAFFRTISAMSDAGGGRLPTWLSTHPAPDNRVERVLAAAEPLVAGRADLRVARESYWRRIDAIVFGPDPRQGVVVDGAFRHP
ncbi:MAG TPA: M48 family metallopeptidase, partial [Acidobacteriota bacterium]|nr:M48 family metallopeptidase [Acidobacteriota bacterium]